MVQTSNLRGPPGGVMSSETFFLAADLVPVTGIATVTFAAILSPIAFHPHPSVANSVVSCQQNNLSLAHKHLLTANMYISILRITHTAAHLRFVPWQFDQTQPSNASATPAAKCAPGSDHQRYQFCHRKRDSPGHNGQNSLHCVTQPVISVREFSSSRNFAPDKTQSFVHLMWDPRKT
jgi:hypothetical protein